MVKKDAEVGALVEGPCDATVEEVEEVRDRIRERHVAPGLDLAPVGEEDDERQGLRWNVKRCKGAVRGAVAVTRASDVDGDGDGRLPAEDGCSRRSVARTGPPIRGSAPQASCDSRRSRSTRSHRRSWWGAMIWRSSFRAAMAIQQFCDSDCSLGFWVSDRRFFGGSTAELA